MIRIDGSSGEGGGQILRSSLSLSVATGQPFRIERIRAARERPGLLRQHLTAVLAAAEVSGAKTEGAALGSQGLTFAPGAVQPGEYRFAVGTAGSGTLVLQTILPALWTSSGPTRLIIEGGTHNPLAPPFDFLEKTFLPIVNRMGPKVTVKLERYGFYPAGGGRFTVNIEPSRKLTPLDLTERGKITGRCASAIIANLPRHIAQRELDTAAGLLNLGPECLRIVGTRESAGPGNAVLIEIESAPVVEIFSAIGKVGVSAEKVAAEAAGAALAYIESGAAAGEHLADQLLLPLALAGGGAFTAENLNLHARTNMDVISKFLRANFKTREAGRCWHVSCGEG